MQRSRNRSSAAAAKDIPVPPPLLLPRGKIGSSCKTSGATVLEERLAFLVSSLFPFFVSQRLASFSSGIRSLQGVTLLRSHARVLGHPDIIQRARLLRLSLGMIGTGRQGKTTRCGPTRPTPRVRMGERQNCRR